MQWKLEFQGGEKALRLFKSTLRYLKVCYGSLSFPKPQTAASKTFNSRGVIFMFSNFTRSPIPAPRNCLQVTRWQLVKVQPWVDNKGISTLQNLTVC